eukprot:TRINITY_DN6733_c0_g1_i1.p1 TRINITY_DN6733_c0_g1~~TRINITY_DN6733_c0_g1_i1.p1  ORF type:complete len:1054 (+),score=289.67 TRINITY_DN6733_c0_g1_i1:298-3162(+)
MTLSIQEEEEIELDFEQPRVSILSEVVRRGFNEQDIWRGEPGLYEVLTSEKIHPLMELVIEEVEVFVHDKLPIAFNLSHVPEFMDNGAIKKAFKISPHTPIYQVVALICRKFEIALPRRFTLSSLKGYIFDDNKPLSYYGFGSFLQSWELNLHKKSESELLEWKDEDVKEYVVTFFFPHTPEFNNMDRTSRKINPNLPTGQLVDLLCRRYEIPSGFKYRLSPDQDGQYLFSRKLGLGHYGLGSRFNIMKVYVISWNDDSKRKSLNMRGIYSWTQFDDDLALQHAREIIRSLDVEVISRQKKSSELENELKKLRVYLRKQKIETRQERKSVDELVEKLRQSEEEKDSIIDKVNQVIDIVRTQKITIASHEDNINSQMGEIGNLQRRVVEENEKCRNLEYQLEKTNELMEEVRQDLELQLLGSQTENQKLNMDLESLTQTCEELTEHIEIKNNKLDRCGRVMIRQRDEMKLKEEQIDQYMVLLETIQADMISKIQEIEQLGRESEVFKGIAKKKFEELLNQNHDEKRKFNAYREEAEQALRRRDDEIERVTRELESKLSTITSLEEEMQSNKQSFNQAINNLQSIITEKEQNYSQEVNALQRKMLEKDGSSDQKMKEIMDNHEQQMNKANEDISELRNHNNSLASELQKANSDIQKFQSEIKNQEEKYISTQSSTNDLKDEIVKLQNELRSTEENLSVFKSEIAQLKQEITETTDEKSKLERDLSSSRNNEQVLNNQLIQAKNAATKSSDNSTEINTLNESIINLQEKFKRESDARDREKKTNTQLTKDIASAKAEIEELKREIRDEKSSFLKLNLKCEGLERELKDEKDRGNVTEPEPTIIPNPAPAAPAVPAPAAPTAPVLNVTKSDKSSFGAMSLSDQLGNIKSSLQKMDKNMADPRSKERSADSSNSLAEVLALGLERKFQTLRMAENLEDIEDLDIEDDDFYFEENADEWD